MIHKLWHWLFGRRIVICDPAHLPQYQAAAALEAEGYRVVWTHPLCADAGKAVHVLDGAPLATWRPCAACDGTGKQAPLLEGFSGPPDTAAMLSQGICWACKGRGGYVEAGGPA